MPQKKQWVREGAEQRGRPRIARYGRTHSVYLSPEQDAAIRGIADREQCSTASVIRAGVRLVISQYERARRIT